VKPGGFAAFRGAVQALLTMLLVKTHYPGRVYRHYKTPLEAEFVQRLFVQQRLYHVPFQHLQMRVRQYFHDVVHGIWVRQSQFEQFSIVFAEVSVIAQVVQFVARAGFEQKHRQAGGNDFRQFIVATAATVCYLPHPLEQLREKVLDGPVHLIRYTATWFGALRLAFCLLPVAGGF